MATQEAVSVDAGKRAVQEAVRRLAGEYKLPVGGFRWKDDFPGAYLYSLYFDVGDAGETGSIELSVRQLEACGNPGNRSAQAGLEDQVHRCLREVIQRLEQSGKTR